MANDFGKAYKLKSKSDLDLLFKEGMRFNENPVRILYRIIPHSGDAENLQVAFAVPKRQVRKAAHRNLIKRRLKESWRLNQLELVGELKENKLTMHVMVIYTRSQAAQTAQTAQVRPKIILSLQRLTNALVQL